jgi:hypothetical protein
MSDQTPARWPLPTMGERNSFTGAIEWVQIDLGEDDHNHLITPEQQFEIAMAWQQRRVAKGGVGREDRRIAIVAHPVCHALNAESAHQTAIVISIETTLAHPTRHFVKLQGTVAMTETGNDLCQ